MNAIGILISTMKHFIEIFVHLVLNCKIKFTCNSHGQMLQIHGHLKTVSGLSRHVSPVNGPFPHDGLSVAASQLTLKDQKN